MSRTANVSLVNEVSSSNDSDQSDSEIGAVGGVRHLNLGKENPLLSLGKSPPENLKNCRNGESQSSSSRNNPEDTAVIEVSGSCQADTDGGQHNSGFVVDGEGEESDEEGEECYHGDNVVFVEGGRKEEKKSNGII